MLRRLLSVAFLLLKFSAGPAMAALPVYEGNLQLQVRSNIVDGFNLPPNSSFNSKSPSLAEDGRVAISLGIVGGNTDTVGLWLGGGGIGLGGVDRRQ